MKVQAVGPIAAAAITASIEPFPIAGYAASAAVAQAAA